jgi:hypothetical protein
MKGRSDDSRFREAAAEIDGAPRHRKLLRPALPPETGKVSIKDLLLAIPPGGEDSDFERIPDSGRDCEL